MIEFGEEIKVWGHDKLLNIDVRRLNPPQPMVAILSLLESEESLSELLVHIDREPIYLFPELDERGWNYDVRKIDNDYYQIHLRKPGNAS